MNKYYLELPDNYKLDKTIDAKNFLFGLLLNVLALVVGGIVFFITYILKFQNLQIPENDRQVVLQLLIILSWYDNGLVDTTLPFTLTL